MIHIIYLLLIISTLLTTKTSTHSATPPCIHDQIDHQFAIQNTNKVDHLVRFTNQNLTYQQFVAQNIQYNIFNFLERLLASHYNHIKLIYINRLKINEQQRIKAFKIRKLQYHMNWYPIRIKFDTDALKHLYPKITTFLHKSIIPIVKSKIESMFKIIRTKRTTYRKIHIRECNGLPIKEHYNTVGLKDHDFLILMTGEILKQQTYTAYSQVCLLDRSELFRPIVAKVNLNLYYLERNSNLDNLSTIIHEIFHALGFSHTLYQYFFDKKSLKIMDANTGIKVVGQNALGVAYKQVVDVAKDYYNCNQIQTMYLEDLSQRSRSSHWKYMLASQELMAPIGSCDTKISLFTLGFFNNMGWYNVNLSKSEQNYMVFGKSKGCDFYFNNCKYKKYDEFCGDGFHFDCQFEYKYWVVCKKNYVSGSCNMETIYYQTSCRDPKLNKQFVFFNGGNQYGPDSRCFRSDLKRQYTHPFGKRLSIDMKLRCLRSQCLQKQDGTKFIRIYYGRSKSFLQTMYLIFRKNFMIPKQNMFYIDCFQNDHGKWKQVPSGKEVTGKIQCPNLNRFCTIYQSSCNKLNSCCGRGTCHPNSQNKQPSSCTCLHSFSGNQCQINQGIFPDYLGSQFPLKYYFFELLIAFLVFYLAAL